MRINKELRVIELFSGVGSQTQALKNICVPHRVAAVSDNDIYADKSYRALHGKNVNNLGDIQKITELPPADLWTYSFPCQSLSVAGRQEGLYGGTRSGLLWEVERLLRVAAESGTLPKYLLLENVKNLVSKNFKPDFDKWLAVLTAFGYKNFYKVINAKDYLPQNRERVFCVSILDNNANYEFPAPPVRATKLKDFLDEEVDGNYYLKISAAESVLKSKFHSRRDIVQTKDYCQALRARDYNGPACAIMGSLKLKDFLDAEADEKYYLKIGTVEGMLRSKFGFNRRRVQTTDVCRTLPARDFYHPVCVPTGKLESAVWDMLKRLTDVEKGGIPLPARNEPIIVAQRGRNPENPNERTAGMPTEQRFEFNRSGVCNTLTSVQKDNLVCTIDWFDNEVYTFEDIFNGLKLRRLTEREYWRLMGWKDSEINKVIAAGISKRHMYMQSGNSIVLPVLEAIFGKLFL